jgi:excisionase family DNA binding protein
VIIVGRVVERHLAAAVVAYVDALRRNGMAVPTALTELRAAFGDLSRQGPTAFDGDATAADGVPMALVFDAGEVADVLRVSERSVERLLASGDLPSVRIGRSRRIRGEDLQEFIDALPVSTREDKQ